MEPKPQEEGEQIPVRVDPTADVAQVNEQPVTEPAAPPDAPGESEPNQEALSTAKDPAPEPPVPPAANSAQVSHEHAPIGVIVSAVLIAVSLAAVTSYLFIANTAVVQEDKTSQPRQTQAVDQAEFERLSSDIDTAAGTAEDQFTDSELSDTTLGL